MKQPKMPKKLGVKMGTKEQVVWEQLKKQSLVQIEQLENSLLVQREVLKLAIQKIKEEETKSVGKKAF